VKRIDSLVLAVGIVVGPALAVVTHERPNSIAEPTVYEDCAVLEADNDFRWGKAPERACGYSRP
jgi:hypothetical protein